MVQRVWVNENRKTQICVDSYDHGVLQGRFYTSFRGMETFDSLTQLLIRMENLLEENRVPQSYTSSRSFAQMLQQDDNAADSEEFRPGALATFELQILFRQHSSWQGQIIWQDQKMVQSFRSVLELIILMDSALRSQE